MSAPSLEPVALAEFFLSRLGSFFRFLQSRGLAVGVGAQLDCAEALRRVHRLDQEAVLVACRLTLAKSPSDLALLDEAFTDFWYSLRAAPKLPDAARPPARRPPADGRASQDLPASRAIPVERSGEVQVGRYSANAPAVGHPLRPLDRTRFLRVNAGARRFRRYAASLPGRRQERARNGRVDFPATVRRGFRYGGEWIDLRRRRRRLNRAEFAILWDVSGSMREHDDALFAIVYALVRASRRSRTFAFSTELRDITDWVRSRSYLRAADAVARVLGPASGGTQIGRCLLEFERLGGSFVHPSTTLVILSDGWDLGETKLLGEELDRFARRCARIVWVNPYADDPGFAPATAAMREALPHLHALLGPQDFEDPTFAATRRPVSRPAASSTTT